MLNVRPPSSLRGRQRARVALEPPVGLARPVGLMLDALDSRTKRQSSSSSIGQAEDADITALHSLD